MGLPKRSSGAAAFSELPGGVLLPEEVEERLMRHPPSPPVSRSGEEEPVAGTSGAAVDTFAVGHLPERPGMRAHVAKMDTLGNVQALIAGEKAMRVVRRQVSSPSPLLANTRGALQTDGKFSRTEYGEDDGGNVGNYVDFDLSDLPTPPVVHFKAQRPKALPDQTYVFAFCGSRSPHALTDVPRFADQTACSMSSMATMC